MRIFPIVYRFTIWSESCVFCYGLYMLRTASAVIDPIPLRIVLGVKDHPLWEMTECHVILPWIYYLISLVAYSTWFLVESRTVYKMTAVIVTRVMHWQDGGIRKLTWRSDDLKVTWKKRTYSFFFSLSLYGYHNCSS